MGTLLPFLETLLGRQAETCNVSSDSDLSSTAFHANWNAKKEKFTRANLLFSYSRSLKTQDVMDIK
jgi:hypothetical protein